MFYFTLYTLIRVAVGRRDRDCLYNFLLLRSLYIYTKVYTGYVEYTQRHCYYSWCSIKIKSTAAFSLSRVSRLNESTNENFCPISYCWNCYLKAKQVIVMIINNNY